MKYFSLLREGNVHPASGKRRIPASEFTQLISAQELIEKAKADSRSLIEQKQKEGEILKEAAKEEGFEQGQKDFAEKIVELDVEIKRLRHELNRMVLPLAMQAAKKIVAKELELHPDTIVDIVLNAIQPVTESKKVSIFVSKQDRQALEKAKPKIAERLPHVETLIIQEKDLTPGSCLIQTEGGMINASIENQWKALERAFEKYFTKKK